ncbi:MAG: hypothetical protein AB1432_02815 [Bacteroidota bacterium]|jgi:hypothetical protein
MFDKIKFNLAHFIIRKKYLLKTNTPLSFNNILSDSTKFLLIMPNNNDEFTESLLLINYLLENKKFVTLFIHESKLNMIPKSGTLVMKNRNLVVLTFVDENRNRLNLPVNLFAKSLKSKEYDVVMDLNRSCDLFLTSIANIVKSRVKVGFEQEKTGDFYDIRIVNFHQDPAQIYSNYINFLKMF